MKRVIIAKKEDGKNMRHEGEKWRGDEEEKK